MKLGVYDAVIRSKLMYGLESAQVNDSLKYKMDAFKLKGLRQISKVSSTYVNRANTNGHFFNMARVNATLDGGRQRSKAIMSKNEVLYSWTACRTIGKFRRHVAMSTGSTSGPGPGWWQSHTGIAVASTLHQENE